MRRKQKVLSMMVLAFRITITQSVLAILFATILFAKDAHSQGVLEKKFSLVVKNVTIESLIMSVQKEANVKFSFSPNPVISGKTIDYQAVNKTIQSFLEEMILPNGINYREVNNQIVLFTQTKGSSTLPIASLVKSTQVRLIEGIIYNEQGQPEQGVSVKIKGSSAGTMTDAEGRYSIEGPDGNFTLVVSAVGYVTTEIPVTNQTRLNITLKAADKVLDDVVVVEYGTQRKADVTGSVVRISTEKTSDLPNYNILQSLQGRAPGLNVTSPDRPGENPQITIRGVNSISASTTPLIVLDGVIYNGNLSEINANDIASVDVLKDASAAAVYGSRAANGVLLITSKTGKTGSPQGPSGP
jgi:TonB-dependent SusC/RagA subfamily outer membrane receptor